MDSSEVSSGNNKEKKESNLNYSFILTFVFLAIAIFFLFLRLTGALDTNQYMTLLLTDAFLFVSSLSLILSTRQLNISKLQEEAARESILASRDSIKSAVAPRLIFRIRPANDYWLDPFGTQASWEPGVGIYIDNFGLGPALNIRLLVKAVGEDEEHRWKFVLPRLLPGTSTLPSKKFPQLKVKKIHKKIVIESLEYDDIRNPPNQYRDEEPEILELKPEDFDESARKSQLFTEVNVEYLISTTSDWTSFSIDGEEKWEDQDIKILSGRESLKSPPTFESRQINLTKKEYDPTSVKIVLNVKMIIPKNKLDGKILYVIKKGDIESTTVEISAENRIVTKLTNDKNIPTDSENRVEWYIPVEKHLR